MGACLIRWDAVISRDQARAAFQLGVERAQRGLDYGRVHNYSFSPTPAARRFTDGMACVAEILVAAYLGRTHLSSGEQTDAGLPDVEGGIEVRWTPYTSGSLIVHPEDDDAHSGVLCTGSGQALAIRGWVPFIEAKAPEFWRTHSIRHPAYFVPQSRLHDIALSVSPLTRATSNATSVRRPEAR